MVSKFSIRNGLNQTSTGKITQKAGEIPYYHADYTTAKIMTKAMYATDNERKNSVHSGLVTSTSWSANGTVNITSTSPSGVSQTIQLNIVNGVIQW